MTKLEYSPIALEKLGAIHKYIAEELLNPGSAANTLESIRDRIRKLKTMPKIGAPLSSRCAELPESLQDARVLVCGNYMIIYLYDGKNVRVLCIYHTLEDYIRHIFNDY